MAEMVKNSGGGGVLPAVDDLESIEVRLRCCSALLNELNNALADIATSVSLVSSLADAYIGAHDLLCSIRGDLYGIIEEAGGAAA